VLGRTEWAAIAASRAIETTWSDWAGLPDQAKLWDYVRNTKVNKDEDLQKVGDATEALKTPNAKLVNASYNFAIHTHGSLGPSCAVAEIVDGELTCWSASQQTHLLRKQIANMLSMKPENVRCVYIEGAGCYGRNGHDDAAADAALIAKETGFPGACSGSARMSTAGTRKDRRRCSTTARRSTTRAMSSRGSRRSSSPNGRKTSWSPAAGGARQLPREDSHPGNIHGVTRDPVHVREHPGQRALARRDAVSPVVDPHAGSHAEHVRQRELR
jgi:CO/xanthine dehydrogenase Mo-binding subunit